MNALLHRHCAKYIYVLPDGLRELMSDISREVLRSHPEQMYTFIADYLDALMITRENARVAARLVECITEIGVTIVELLTKTGITRDDAAKAAAIIQVAFRRHLEQKREFQLKQLNITKEEEEEFFTTQIIEQCGISVDKADEAARIIQDAYRRFRQHEKVEHDLLLGMIDWRVAARSAIYLYRKTGVSMYEANKAATLIKAAYKGYYTRQVMRRLVEKGHQAFNMEVEKGSAEITDSEEVDEDIEEEIEEEIEAGKRMLKLDKNEFLDEHMDDMAIANEIYVDIINSMDKEICEDEHVGKIMTAMTDDNQIDVNLEDETEEQQKHEEDKNEDNVSKTIEGGSAQFNIQKPDKLPAEREGKEEKNEDETIVGGSAEFNIKKPDKLPAEGADEEEKNEDNVVETIVRGSAELRTKKPDKLPAEVKDEEKNEDNVEQTIEGGSAELGTKKPDKLSAEVEDEEKNEDNVAKTIEGGSAELNIKKPDKLPADVEDEEKNEDNVAKTIEGGSAELGTKKPDKLSAEVKDEEEKNEDNVEQTIGGGSAELGTKKPDKLPAEVKDEEEKNEDNVEQTIVGGSEELGTKKPDNLTTEDSTVIADDEQPTDTDVTENTEPTEPTGEGPTTEETTE